MSNRRQGRYDSGAESNGVTEAEIVMTFANEVRRVLRAQDHLVVRTRLDAEDPAPVGQRAAIARAFDCDVLVSLHCNSANSRARGTETFYRGKGNQAFARRCNDAIVSALGTKNRGIKTEEQSQHSRLAVLNFPKACLIELAFIDNAADRALLLDEARMRQAAANLAEAIVKSA